MALYIFNKKTQAPHHLFVWPRKKVKSSVDYSLLLEFGPLYAFSVH